MRKKCVILKNCIHLAAIGRYVGNILTIKQDNTCVGFFKPGNKPQCRRFAAATGTQQRHEFIFINRQIKSVQYEMTIKGL